MDRRRTGRLGEQLAARYLEQKGYRVFVRNWRSHGVEIDLIARDASGEVVFVEVKTRRSRVAGRPEASITPSKRAHLERGALAWMQSCTYAGPWRVDVVAVELIGPAPELTHFIAI